jgi:hypothetical protein
LGTEFRTEKIQRNRLGTVSVILRKNKPIPRHSEFRGRDNTEARKETEFRGNYKFYKAAKMKFSAAAFRSELFSLLWNGSERHSESFFFHRMEFREFASIFVPRNGIQSCFLFHGRIQYGIPKVCFYFCSMERKSESFLFCRTGGIPSEKPFVPSIPSPKKLLFFANSQPYVHIVSRISSAVGVPADASTIVGDSTVAGIPAADDSTIVGVGDSTVAGIPAIAGVPLAELGNQ